jgi:hypothetical protein
MATKPLLPEVIAERAKAADDYRKAQQAAIDRIETLRAARLQRAAEIDDAKADAVRAKVGTRRAVPKSDSAKAEKSEKRARPAGARTNAQTGA